MSPVYTFRGKTVKELLDKVLNKFFDLYTFEGSEETTTLKFKIITTKMSDLLCKTAKKILKHILLRKFKGTKWSIEIEPYKGRWLLKAKIEGELYSNLMGPLLEIENCELKELPKGWYLQVRTRRKI